MSNQEGGSLRPIFQTEHPIWQHAVLGLVAILVHVQGLQHSIRSLILEKWPPPFQHEPREPPVLQLVVLVGSKSLRKLGSAAQKMRRYGATSPRSPATGGPNRRGLLTSVRPHISIYYYNLSLPAPRPKEPLPSICCQDGISHLRLAYRKCNQASISLLRGAAPVPAPRPRRHLPLYPTSRASIPPFPWPDLASLTLTEQK